MNAKLLKGHMAIHGDSMDSLAAVLGINTLTLYGKMRGAIGKRKVQFTQGEIKAIADRYGLAPDVISAIFF